MPRSTGIARILIEIQRLCWAISMDLLSLDFIENEAIFCAFAELVRGIIKELVMVEQPVFGCFRQAFSN